jgi:hypothetical protein
MQRDLLKELQEWLNGNPEENEIITIRAPDRVIVKLQYGGITTVTKEGKTVQDALAAALDRARELPAKKRIVQEKLVLTLPGLED